MSGPLQTAVRAPAKLTWSLHVGGRRSDGLHEIDAEMITLDLADTLTLSEPGSGLALEASDNARAAELLGDEDNLVARALKLCGRQAHVTLKKVIPLGGGLGGGSADAGAVLRWAGFNEAEQACALGSDVPFCVTGGRARVLGVGEIVEPLPFEERTVVLLVPPLHIDTASVYRAFDALRVGDRTGSERNDLFAAALVAAPQLQKWVEAFGHQTGCPVFLAGSGSTLFIEGPLSQCGLSGQQTLTIGQQTGALIEASSVPASFGLPTTL